MGSIHLRFPVAGQWSLSVEYEGVVYTKLIEVHGQRGKQAKLQSKLAADALHGGQGIVDEMMESEDSMEETASTSTDTTPRHHHNMRTRQSHQHLHHSRTSEAHVREPVSPSYHGGGYGSKDGVVVKQEHESSPLSESGSTSRSSTDWSSQIDSTPSYLNPSAVNASHGMRSMSYGQMSYQSQHGGGMNGPLANHQIQQQPMQHGASFSHMPSHHSFQHSNGMQYSSQPLSHLQPPFPLQPLSSMSLIPDNKLDMSSLDPVYGSSSHMFGSMPSYTSNHAPHNPFDPYSQMPESPNVSEMMMSGIPEGSTFAYNDMGQYGSASHMKHQEAEMNYIQPDAMYYPIPPACADDLIQNYMTDSPSSPSADSSDGSSGTSTPIVRSGYPFLSRIIPGSTSDVVSLGQECCLVGQNYVYSDSDANSIWFTLQANKAKVKAPIQRSTSTTHIATIPPLSYFGISYALEPLMAIVELYQYSLLVPCEQQFYYLTTSGQMHSSNKISVQEHGGASFQQGPSDASAKDSSFMQHGSNDRDATTSTGAYFVGGTGYGGSSFFFNTGVPSLNTLTVDNNLEAIQTLVENGADVNQTDLWGITPLHLAIFFGRRAIANYLLRLGVEKSVQIEDINGDTPLDLVIRHWDPEIRGLYDVMVSLLHDPSQTVSEADRATRETLSRRAASAGAAANLPKKPSFLLANKKPIASSPDKTLSSKVPFQMHGDTLRVLRPEFWAELQIAMNQLKVGSSAPASAPAPVPASAPDALNEEQRTLAAWSEIFKAKHIDSSDLSLDRFPTIPVHAFPLIERLDLSGNALRFLPHDWSNFKTLSTLDVSRNLIDILPPTLAELPSLTSFLYGENPLRLLPSVLTKWTSSSTSSSSSSSSHRSSNRASPFVSDKDAQASKVSTQTPQVAAEWTRTPLYKYLHEISLSSEQMITDSKVRVNVLGERYTDRRLLQKSLQVDFNSFVTRLRYKVPLIAPSDDVSVEDVNGKFATDLSFETWTAGARHTDFASQALITPSGIQVVLFSLIQPDMNKEAERIQYWLQAIAARAPSAPVLLVGCHAESLVASRDPAPLMSAAISLATSILSPAIFNPTEDAIAVSFSNGEGMDALKRRFLDIAHRHGMTNKIFPKAITLLTQSILALKEVRWFLWRSELVDLAMQFGVDMTSASRFETVVQQLSALGGLVHFSDASSDRLRDIVFTDPQRLCHALTNFPMRHKRLIKDGVLHLADCHPQFVSILNGLPVPNDQPSGGSGSPGTPPSSPAFSGSQQRAVASSTTTNSAKNTKGASSAANSVAAAGTSSPTQSLLGDLALGGSSPRSASPPTTGSPHSEEASSGSGGVSEMAQASSRNSKGFLTSPIKAAVRSSSSSSVASQNQSSSSVATTKGSPLICRVRIDDRVLVDLLVLFEEAIRLPNEAVLLPRLLPESVSEDMLLQYWSQGLAHTYERVYQFSGAVLPKIFFNRFRTYLYEDSRVEVCLHWSRGMVLRYAGERARLSSPTPNTLHLNVSGDMPSRLLPMMVEMIDALIEAFAPKMLGQVLIPCPSLSSATTTLRLEEAMDALRDGQTHITRARTNIRLSVVAPDLCLQEMQALEVEEAALVTSSSDKLIADAFEDMIEMVGSEGVSSSDASASTVADLGYVSLDSKSVWSGKLRGTEDVHVAYYHRNVSPAQYKTKQEYLQAVQAADLASLKECRAEARLLMLLQHPNVVRARAFNLAAQQIATETSSYGTLRSFLAQRTGASSSASSTAAAATTAFSPELKLRMMFELTQAVAWLHANRVVHCALNLDAVLVTSLDVNPQHEHVKIGQFHQAKRCFTRLPHLEANDIRGLGILFAQIWTGSLDPNEAIHVLNTSVKALEAPNAAIAAESSATSDSNNLSSSSSSPSSSSSNLLEFEISELIHTCLAATSGLEMSEVVAISGGQNSTLMTSEPTVRPISTGEIMQHLEYMVATNGWLLNYSQARLVSSQQQQNQPAHSYWKLESATRILEYNEREIASISSIIRASDGQVWVATASGYIHIWNPSRASNSISEGASVSRAIIQTYSIDTRQSRRRINALMTSGAYVWCITDGSICVYSNDGQLVKSIMHKQSLCITKYQMPPQGTTSSGSSAASATSPAPISGSGSSNGASSSSTGNTGAGNTSGASSSSTQPHGSRAGDGMVYIGGAHGEISVWDSATFHCTLGVVLENRLPITAIAVDSRYLWIGVGVSRRICHVVVLNKRTLNEICRFQAHDDLISSIVVVDDSHIWTSSFDGKINVWNIAAESDNKVVIRLEKSIMTHRRAILKMTASPRTSDGSVNKVYASDNTSISVWDTKHNQLIDKHLIGRHRGAIGALDSIDANHFLSASVEDGCVCLWKYCNPPPI
jgi:hypothetical protein